MRNIFIFFGALLLVDGVFGVDETVTVMEGDSVTLNPHTEIPEDDPAQWLFGEERIARINKADGLFSTFEGDDGRFKGRLNLDHQNGSLTITNITTKHAGLYKLKISGDTVTFKIFSVTVRDEMKTVLVKKGEHIDLDTGLNNTHGYDRIILKFEDHPIAEMKKGTFGFNDAIDTSADGRFKGRLQRHPQSGSLTISDSRINDTGVYLLNMSSSSHTVQRNISVTVSAGVFGVDGTVSVMEGDSVTLKTDTVLTEDDSAMWFFGEERIARINKADGFFSISEGDGIFKDRLNLDHQTGSLTITNTRTVHTGLYKLQISGRTETFKIFSVTVRVSDLHSDKQTPDPGLSSGAVAGIVVGVLLLVFAAAAGVIYHRHKISKLQRSRDVNGTNDPLKVTANIDA